MEFSNQIYEKVEVLRDQLHQLVDERVDGFIQRLAAGVSIADPVWERPLTTSFSLFKGTKAVAVILPDGSEVETHTWRTVVETILKDCARDPQMHERLLYLTNRVNGNHRPLLSSHPEQMDVPIQVDDDIYFEGKLDTEQLLRVLVEKVLKPVGYDCSTVTILHKERGQAQGTEPAQEDVENVDMTMQM